jgi:hypothetical protein
VQSDSAEHGASADSRPPCGRPLAAELGAVRQPKVTTVATFPCWLFLIALVGLVQPPQPSPQAQPLEVTAKYLPGLSLEDPCWTVSLRDPGESSLEVCGEDRNGPRAITVSQNQLIALRETISKERFFDLRKYYGDLPVDGPESRMEVRVGTKAKRVSVFSVKPKMSKQEANEVDRAMRVWFAVLDCFHAPEKRR